MSHSAVSSPYQPLPQAPDWFIRNLQQAGTSLYFQANNRQVHALTWNWHQTSLPVLLLIHGFSGHAHWWSFLAPFFTQRFRVLALDLPGMGDSEALPSYHDECFSNAILALVEQQQLSSVTVIGHSFGGVTMLNSLLRNEQPFNQAIVVDSYIRLPTESPVPILTPRGEHKIRGSRAQSMQHFRLSPDQPVALDYIMDYVGYHSCQQTEQGWQWKFDPHLRNFGEFKDPADLAKLKLPVSLIYGAASMFSTEQRPQVLYQHLGNPGELIMLPAAHHHIMMDHPLELVDAIERCLIT